MDNKYETCILNYWDTSNYGAALTAYAIQEITPCSCLLEKAKENKRYSKWLKIFKDKYLNTVIINNLNDKIFKNYITGSDQVFFQGWSLKTNIVNIMHTYMLDFSPLNSKKISFSASFAYNKYDYQNKLLFENSLKMKNSLKSFDFISVREKSGVEICKDLFDVDAQWIIDPVFILEKSKYDELIENVTPHPNLIL